MTDRPRRPAAGATRSRWAPATALAALVGLCLVSVAVGAADLSPAELLAGGTASDSARILLVSRIPRTLAAVLAGSGVAVAGAVMQMSMRNRFVSPTTAGTNQFALVGLLLVALLAPSTSVMGKMLVACVCAVAGSAILVRLLRLLPERRTPADVTVPLVGLMLGGVVEAGTTFVAWRYDLLQSLGSWTAGDLSRVLAGRYEPLWVVAGLALALYLAADRLTVAGLGEGAATGLGLNYRAVVDLAVAASAVMTAVSVVVVGTLPFLGLVVPNAVSRICGDNLRRALPVIAVGGALLTVGCDVVGRLVHRPYEISLTVIMGVVGAAAFTALILRGVDRG